MAVPKRRVSRARKGNRRSHDHLDLPTVVACKNCGEKIQPHRVCKECGYYKDRNVLEK